MDSKRMAPLPPGSTIGIIGTGQLGRMTALAAARLGYRCHVFGPEADSPAAQVAAAATVAAYTDRAALARFAAAVDVVTFEFENIPHESVRVLAEHVPVRPRWECLHIAQDRLLEKDFLNSIGVPTARYRRVESAKDLAEALPSFGLPAVLKTVRMGYDGKGQALLRKPEEAEAAWAKMGEGPGILESFVNFEREISVIVARGADGTTRCFDPVENHHAHHILDTTLAPAPIKPEMAEQATAMAVKIADNLDLVGLLAVEMFAGLNGEVLVNELAPRPHNSGHWTLDACVTSQFEQFARAVCGLPLGSPERHSDAMMKNLLGEAADDWADILANPAAKLHLYGKAEARPGRKMGHVTRLFPKGSLGR